MEKVKKNSSKKIVMIIVGIIATVLLCIGGWLLGEKLAEKLEVNNDFSIIEMY